MAAKLFLDERNLKQLGFTEPNVRTMRALTEFLNVQNTVTNVVGPLEALTTTGILTRVGLNQWATRTLTGPVAGLTVTNGDGVVDNPTLALANDLAAYEGLAANGIVARTGDGAAAVRTLTAGANISITNGDGVSGNPTIAATGLAAAVRAALVAGTNITITDNGNGTYTIAASGGGTAHAYEKFGALPLASSFTSVSSANLTLTDGNNNLRVSWTASGLNQVQLYTKAAPSTPYDVYLRMRAIMLGTNVQFGLVLRNSSSGKFVLMGAQTAGTLTVQEWTNPTTFSSSLGSVSLHPFAAGTNPGWMRISNDGTNLTFYWSVDGDMWISLGITRALSSFLSSCDQYGFGGVPQSAGSVFISSLGTTAPA